MLLQNKYDSYINRVSVGKKMLDEMIRKLIGITESNGGLLYLNLSLKYDSNSKKCTYEVPDTEIRLEKKLNGKEYSEDLNLAIVYDSRSHKMTLNLGTQNSMETYVTGELEISLEGKASIVSGDNRKIVPLFDLLKSIYTNLLKIDKTSDADLIKAYSATLPNHVVEK